MEHSARIGEIFNYGVLHLEWPTAAFILAVFTVTMILLNFLLFKPLLRTLEGRNKILTERESRLNEITEQLAQTQENFEAKKTATHQTISDLYAAKMAEAQKEAAQITGTIREETLTKMRQAEEEIDKNTEAALEEAKGLSKDLAQLIQTKVLS